jgi:ABC transporter DrrB family efflux protein
MQRWHPFRQLVLARLREFYREPAVLFWVYGFPLLLAIGLGVAFAGGDPGMAEFGTQQATVVDIIDSPDSSEAQALGQRLQEEGLVVHLAGAEQCRQRLRTGQTALVIVPRPDGYQYVYDAIRPGSRLVRYRVDDIVQRWKAAGSLWRTVDVLVDEPGSRYIDFLIPGLMGLNLMGGGLWGVGYVVVDLRVRKLLKRLLATPMRTRDFLLAILASRLVFLVPEMLVLVLAGWLLFGVPMRGALGTLALVLIVGGAAFAGLGLLLASRTANTEVVSGLINLLMLPMWMLSGTFFASSRFPGWLQPLIEALPLTPLNHALRAVMLEGAPLASVLGEVAILAGWAVVSFLVALKWFRWG